MGRKGESLLNMLVECPWWVRNRILTTEPQRTLRKDCFIWWPACAKPLQRRQVRGHQIKKRSLKSRSAIHFPGMAANAFTKGLSGAAPFVALGRKSFGTSVKL